MDPDKKKALIDKIVKYLGAKSGFDPQIQCNWCKKLNPPDLNDCDLCGHYCGYKICKECVDASEENEDEEEDEKPTYAIPELFWDDFFKRYTMARYNLNEDDITDNQSYLEKIDQADVIYILDRLGYNAYKIKQKLKQKLHPTVEIITE